MTEPAYSPLMGQLSDERVEIQPLQLEYPQQQLREYITNKTLMFDDNIMRTFVSCVKFILVNASITNIAVVDYLGPRSASDRKSGNGNISKKDKVSHLLAVVHHHDKGRAQNGHWGLFSMQLAGGNRVISVNHTLVNKKNAKSKDKELKFEPHIKDLFAMSGVKGALSFDSGEESNAEDWVVEYDKIVGRFGIADCGPAALLELVRQVSYQLRGVEATTDSVGLLQAGMDITDVHAKSEDITKVNVRAVVITFLLKMLVTLVPNMRPMAPATPRMRQDFFIKLGLANLLYENPQWLANTPYCAICRGKIVRNTIRHGALVCCGRHLHLGCLLDLVERHEKDPQIFGTPYPCPECNVIMQKLYLVDGVSQCCVAELFIPHFRGSKEETADARLQWVKHVGQVLPLESQRKVVEDVGQVPPLESHPSKLVGQVPPLESSQSKLLGRPTKRLKTAERKVVEDVVGIARVLGQPVPKGGPQQLQTANSALADNSTLAQRSTLQVHQHPDRSTMEVQSDIEGIIDGQVKLLKNRYFNLMASAEAYREAHSEAYREAHPDRSTMEVPMASAEADKEADSLGNESTESDEADKEADSVGNEDPGGVAGADGESCADSADDSESVDTDTPTRPQRFPESRNFDRNEGKETYIFSYGVVYFACGSYKYAISLQKSLARLFVEPKAQSPAPFRCLDVKCQQRFQTPLDQMLHYESQCVFVPSNANMLSRKSAVIYPAHFVHDIAIQMLAKTKPEVVGPLDIINIRALPFRYGPGTVRHLFNVDQESKKERALVAPTKKKIRQFWTYAEEKWKWMDTTPGEDGTRRYPPMFWYFTFIKHPLDWPIYERITNVEEVEEPKKVTYKLLRYKN